MEDFIEDCEKYNKTYSLRDIKEFYNNGNNKSFFDLYESFCRRKSKDINDGTLYVYEVVGKQLKEYCPNLKLGDFDYDFVQDLFDYLKTEKGVHNLFNKKKCLVAFLSEMKKGGPVKENIVTAISLAKQPLKGYLSNQG